MKVGRKTIPLNLIQERLIQKYPHLQIKEDTYVNTQTRAIFVDEAFGEFKAKPHDVLNRGTRHPKRWKHKNYVVKHEPKYDEQRINSILKKKFGDKIKVKEGTYTKIENSCTFVDFDFGEFVSKPSRVLKGIFSRTEYEFKKAEARMMELDVFLKLLKEKRSDVELVVESYNRDYSKKKSVFIFKKYPEHPVRLVPSNVLKGAIHPKDKFIKPYETIFKKYGVRNTIDIPGMKSKVFAFRSMSKPEKKFSEMLKNRNFHFEYEHPLFEGDKFWDFVIFKESKPVAVVEIDGEFVHGFVQDSNSSKVAGVHNAERFKQIPKGIKYIQCDSAKIEEAFEELCRIFEWSYHEWVQEMFDFCKSISFPYPSNSEDRMRNDYKNLCELKTYSKHFYTGNSIITNFHKSIYSSKKEGCVSPLDAWNDEKLLEKSVKNRFIYCPSKNISSVHIARGFEKSKIAPRVSVFQPSLAQYLLKKYASSCKTILDPFSGFSGRMLAATSLNKKYFGYDFRQEVLNESIQIINFLNLKNVSLRQADILFFDAYEKADCVFTCPPYKNKEIWIADQESHDTEKYVDLCLQKIQSDLYIFVLDKKIKKYSKFLKEEITNKSHFGKNKEFVFVIKGI